MKILVIGSTGMIGKPVTKELISAGLPVTLMARNVEKTEHVFPGVPVVFGDIFDPLSLLNAFRDQEALYINISPPRTAKESDRMPEREGLGNIIAVAKEAGIKRIFFLSSLIQSYNGTDGFDWWIFRMKMDAAHKIRASGIPYTIFYASTFFENFDQLLKKGSRIMLASGSKAPMYCIAAKDFGKQVARAFALPATENKEYNVQGEIPYTWDSGAKVFVKHYKKRKLHIMKAPMGLLKFLGFFVPIVHYGYKILLATNNYVEEPVSRYTWQDLGKPAISLEEYAANL
jgi:uncharacterized protein YbjT (DUF2867 family)